MKVSAEYIFKAYRAAGMTEAGAAAMLGAGIEPESAFIVNNVEDRAHKNLGWTDEQYTLAVDNGSYTRFVDDAYGYGLHQWTLKYRKNKMLNRARELGKSVGDIDFQIDFAIYELTGEPEYFALWNALKTSNDVDSLSDMVVGVFERPANITQQKLVRRPLSRKWLKTLSGTVIDDKKNKPEQENGYWPPRTIAKGMSGPDVLLWQALMSVMGYDCSITGEFDNITEKITIEYQNNNGLVGDGIPGPKTWTVASAAMKFN